MNSQRPNFPTAPIAANGSQNRRHNKEEERDEPLGQYIIDRRPRFKHMGARRVVVGLFS